MKDRRFIKTEQAIRETFLNLLKEKSLNKITVSQISISANLGRGTFYLHYKDIYDLYNTIENEIYTELGELFEKSNPYANETNLMDLINNIIDYISEHSNIFEIFIRLEFKGNLLFKLKNYFFDKILHESIVLSRPINNNIDYDVVEANFIVSGVVGVIEHWLNNGMIIPKEDISIMLQKILTKF
ncbi:TetR/AcrR family transcriptional regulator [Clostridium felsineum]|uniref:TetR/AcrR family transcriptional regulator n=1 Tax=Clostridium felsineum TaxID=36839 RepID=UPI00214DDE42|nr:TetR-like C-terminal domain-containing protein [Clostridium felsineum]MCR3760963.1 TetR/AcrR family transcriptional regulator [Clostridium felsineum]